MKALSTPLIIVVTIVVLLVTALVILTIFGNGIGTAAGMTSFASSCRTQAESTCKLFGTLPPNWGGTVSVNVNGKVTPTSCSAQVPITADQCKNAATTGTLVTGATTNTQTCPGTCVNKACGNGYTQTAGTCSTAGYVCCTQTKT